MYSYTTTHIYTHSDLTYPADVLDAVSGFLQQRAEDARMLRQHRRHQLAALATAELARVLAHKRDLATTTQ